MRRSQTIAARYLVLRWACSSIVARSLRELGYVEGKNLVIEFRWAEMVEQLPAVAADLARMNMSVIFAPSSTEVEAARQTMDVRQGRNQKAPASSDVSGASGTETMQALARR